MFNYSNCDMCMKCKNDTKMELYKIFPVEICNRIGDCNVYCCHCSKIRREEVDFLKVNLENTSMSTIERQLLFFKSTTNIHSMLATREKSRYKK